MRSTVLNFLTLLLFQSIVLAQAPAIQWQKCLGGTNNEGAHSIQQTSDGGFIVAGFTNSNDGDVIGNHGGADYWVVKLNSSGSIQWQKALGGTDNDYANSIQQTSDGGYIVSGFSYSTDGDISGNHGGADCWVVKLNANGDQQWQKSMGGTSEDLAFSIQQTSDGGYIMAGWAGSNNGDVSGNHGEYDFWVVKLNSSGSIQWQKCLGGTLEDYASSIQQTSDGGFIVTGFTYSNDGDVIGNHGGADCWMVKLNASGAIQWQMCLGGTNNEGASSIQQTSDGGYILTGETGSFDGDVIGNHGDFDSWVVKLNSSGALQWQKCLGGTNDEGARSIQQTSDGGFIVAGYTYSNDGDVIGNQFLGAFWIIKLNDSGTTQWQKVLGGTGSYSYANCIQQTSDGGFIVAGGTDSIDGDVTGNHGNFDMWVVKLAPDSLSANTFGASESHLYPNPVQNQLQIQTTMPVTSYKISDLSGKLIMQEVQFSGQSIDVSGLAKGMYLLEAAQGETTFMTKFVKE